MRCPRTTASAAYYLGRSGSRWHEALTRTSRRRSAVPGIRLATTDDYPAMRAVLRDAFADLEHVLPDRLYGPYLDDIVDLESRAPSGTFVVAELAGEPVGTVTFYGDASVEGMCVPDGWAGVCAMGVVPGARGLGVGRALMEWCIGRARAQDSTALMLHTAEFMTAAVSLYDALGFTRIRALDFDAAGYLDVPDDAGRTRVLGYVLDVGSGRR